MGRAKRKDKVSTENATKSDERFRECNEGRARTIANRERYEDRERCHAQKDGDCEHEGCPQLRDGEPAKTGRHCPIDTWVDDDY